MTTIKECPKQLVDFLEGEFSGWCAWAKVPVQVDLSIDPKTLKQAAAAYENHYQCREAY